jgi:hypothetical protein
MSYNFRLGCAVLFFVYFISFSASYHLTFIFAVILCYDRIVLNDRADWNKCATLQV